MKLIRTEDAVGQVLCHDITQIIPGEFKGARFRKGHIVQPEDIPVLLSIGKENLYVWEKRPGILHEDEAAALLYKAAAGRNIHGTEPKEGKIELIADCDGLLKIDRAALLAVNRTPQMMIATIHGDLPVKKGQKLAGTRIIPLVIEQEKMDAMQAAAGPEPHRAPDGQRTAGGTGRGIPANRRPADTEGGGTDHQHGAVRGAG